MALWAFVQVLLESTSSPGPSASGPGDEVVFEQCCLSTRMRYPSQSNSTTHLIPEPKPDRRWPDFIPARNIRTSTRTGKKCVPVLVNTLEESSFLGCKNKKVMNDTLKKNEHNDFISNELAHPEVTWWFIKAFILEVYYIAIRNHNNQYDHRKMSQRYFAQWSTH